MVLYGVVGDDPDTAAIGRLLSASEARRLLGGSWQDHHTRLPAADNGGTRGVVVQLSRQSRARLSRFAARFIPHAVTAGGHFGALTDGDSYVSVQRFKLDFKALRERWRRCDECDVYGLWKLEQQERGAWHIHPLVVGVCADHVASLPQDWLDIQGLRGSAEADRLRNGGQLAPVWGNLDGALSCYLGKELSKSRQSGDGSEPSGRCWGWLDRARCLDAMVPEHLVELSDSDFEVLWDRAIRLSETVNPEGNKPPDLPFVPLPMTWQGDDLDFVLRGSQAALERREAFRAEAGIRSVAEALSEAVSDA